MKSRFKQIRKENNLTQQAMAEALNVSKSTIEGYEYGRLNITDRSISDVCRIYGINEEWLRTGEGEMLAPMDKETELAQLTSKLFKAEEGSPMHKLGSLLAQLTEEEAQMLIDVARKLQ